MKLLNAYGYIAVPTVTTAEFVWSVGQFGYDKWPDVVIALDPVTIGPGDIPDLIRLSSNTNYSYMAQAQLQLLGQ